MGMAASLVMWPGPFEQSFVPPSHRSSIWSLTLIGPVVSEEKMFKKCGRRRTTTYDGRLRPTYPISSPLSRWAKNKPMKIVYNFIVYNIKTMNWKSPQYEDVLYFLPPAPPHDTRCSEISGLARKNHIYPGSPEEFKKRHSFLFLGIFLHVLTTKCVKRMQILSEIGFYVAKYQNLSPIFAAARKNIFGQMVTLMYPGVSSYGMEADPQSFFY